MTDVNKRKGGPGRSGDGPSRKKSKGGGGGRWQTPHFNARKAEKIEKGIMMDVGDQGIWVTHARNMGPKAVREFRSACEEYAKEMYGIKPPSEEQDEDDGAEETDIAASIEQELNSLREAKKKRRHFSLVNCGLECVFFMKTMLPVEPDRLIKRMCEDAKACSDLRKRKTKYINRLTPVFDTDKATDNGVERVARRVLASWFALTSEGEENVDKAAVTETSEPKTADGEAPCTYAIRHSIRNHTALKSDSVIKKIAGIIQPQHKVNLGHPDKVILVEIYQTFCGLSVVDGKAWDDLKRYNVHESYMISPGAMEAKTAGSENKPEKKDDTVPS